MRKYPEPSDYQSAIQNPNLVLRDPHLRTARVRVDRLGMPVVSSGGFAFSFYLQAQDDSRWVVRCFKADSPDRRARYDAISRFLNAHPDPILLDVDYLEEGILVNGAWYPIVKMPLVRGVTLQRGIEAELTAGSSIAHLSEKFRAIVDRLEQMKIAHGDLQHGNIMVQHGELVLIDYDGMYVPALRGWPAAEMGSAAYQHPLRQDQFSPALDRFSAIVIDMALQALAAVPGLWTKYNTGENILFRKTDFMQPESSPLLHDLEQIPYLREAVHRLRTICKGPFDAIPKLGDVLPPLPDDVQPMTLPGMPQVIASAFTWDTGGVRADEGNGLGDGDIDTQLTRLYTNWIPTTPGTNWSATGTPIAMPAAPALSLGQPRPIAPGPLTPPAPLLAPVPQPATSPAARHGGAQHAPAHAAQGKPEGPRFGEAGRVVYLFLTIALMLTRVASCANTQHYGSTWQYAAPTPGAGAGFAIASSQITPLAVGECPTKVKVELEEPRKRVQGSVATFAWLGSPQLPKSCHYRVKLWRADGTAIALSAAAAAADQVATAPNRYQAVIDMTKDFPPGQQFSGSFFWTVELVDTLQDNAVLSMHGLPWSFTWVPQ